jgi:hypothetical protein
MYSAEVNMDMSPPSVPSSPRRPLIRVEDLGLFRLKDVVGDGNCFFNALVLSQDINIDCPIELMEFLVKSLIKNPKAKNLYDSVVDGDHDIYDYAPSHVCNEVQDWIKQENETLPDSEKYIVEMVDPCLTSVYQPPDVAINKPLKPKIRALYQQHLSMV